VTADKADAGFKGLTTDLDRYLESLSKALEQELELTEVQKAQLRIAEASATGFSEVQRQVLLGTAAQIDAQRTLKTERADSLRAAIELDANLAAADQGAAARLKTLIDATPTAKLEEQRRDQLLLVAALEAGALSQQQYLEAASAVAGILNQELQQTKSIADELGLTFTSLFEDAIIGGKKFGDVLKDILRMVVRENVAKPLSDALTGLLGGGGGSGSGGFLGGIFGKLFSADGGGYTGSGARSGGLDGKGGFLGMLHPQETVIDHTRGQRGAGSGQTTIINNFTVGDVASVSMVRQAIAASQRQVQGAMARSIEYGGALS